MDDIIIKAVLKGTNIAVTFALTPMQYWHYRYVQGKPVPPVAENVPLDRTVAAEMRALAAHFAEPEV